MTRGPLPRCFAVALTFLHSLLFLVSVVRLKCATASPTWLVTSHILSPVGLCWFDLT